MREHANNIESFKKANSLQNISQLYSIRTFKTSEYHPTTSPFSSLCGILQVKTISIASDLYATQTATLYWFVSPSTVTTASKTLWRNGIPKSFTTPELLTFRTFWSERNGIWGANVVREYRIWRGRQLRDELVREGILSVVLAITKVLMRCFSLLQRKLVDLGDGLEEMDITVRSFEGRVYIGKGFSWAGKFVKFVCPSGGRLCSVQQVPFLILNIQT